MINLIWFIFYQKNSSTTIRTSTNMEYAEIRMQREANKIVELGLVNNRKFDQKVALLIRIIPNDRLKEHMKIINGKYTHKHLGIINSQASVQVKFSDVKYASKLFGVLKKSIKLKVQKEIKNDAR